MSIIPERVFQNEIRAGMKILRTNPRLLASLFGHLTEPEFESIVTFIVKQPITFHINYPRDELNLPSLILLMKTENESQGFLGDVLGDEPHYGLPDPQFQADSSDTAESTSTMPGLTPKLFGNLAVVSSAGSGVTVEETAEWLELVEDGIGLPAKLHVIAGTGKGQVATICKIGPTTIDIDAPFDVNLDNTSLVDVRSGDTSEQIVGEPSRALNPNARVARIGSNYETQYQLDIVAGHQEQVIYLYTVLQAVFFLRRKSLESQGIQALRISGSDFAPRSEFLPDEVFHRVMNLSFTRTFGMLVELEEINNIELVIDVSDPISQEEDPAFSYTIEI